MFSAIFKINMILFGSLFLLYRMTFVVSALICGYTINFMIAISFLLYSLVLRDLKNVGSN